MLLKPHYDTVYRGETAEQRVKTDERLSGAYELWLVHMKDQKLTNHSLDKPRKN